MNNNKLVWGLFIIVVGVLFVGFIYYDRELNKAGDEVLKWRNQAALLDSVKAVDSTNYEILAQSVREIKTDNKVLLKELRNTKSELRSVVDIHAAYVDSIKDIQTEALIDSDGREIGRTFNITDNEFYLKGNFLIEEPYTISFNEIRVDIDLSVNLIEDKFHTWRAFVETSSPRMSIDKIEPKVVPYSPSLWERTSLRGGLYTGRSGNGFRIGGLAMLSMNNHSMFTVIDNYGIGFGYARRFK